MASNEQIEERALRVQSLKVKKYVREGLLPKIEQAGPAAGIWLEDVEAHFDKLKPEGYMQGFEETDFDDLYFVLTGGKRKKAEE